MTSWFQAPAPVTRTVRAYFAPVNRTTQTPVLFELAQQGSFDLDSPPAPWVDLGAIQNFMRKSTSKNAAVMTGAPATVLAQVRESVSAEVSFEFLSWTKLTMALATGSQHMNLLSGQAIPVQSGSTATFIALGSSDTTGFTAGQLVAVDVDYTGQTGFIGSPVTGAYVRRPLADADYVRRVTFNVALVANTDATGITLAAALPGSATVEGAKVQVLNGFADREGGSFVQECSALFVMEGTLGERIFFYYPRLQPMYGAEETALPLTGKGKLRRIALKAQFCALPVADSLDGESVVCYRSFLPAKNARV